MLPVWRCEMNASPKVNPTKENVDAALVAVFGRITDLYYSENHFLCTHLHILVQKPHHFKKFSV